MLPDDEPHGDAGHVQSLVALAVGGFGMDCRVKFKTFSPYDSHSLMCVWGKNRMLSPRFLQPPGQHEDGLLSAPKVAVAEGKAGAAVGHGLLISKHYSPALRRGAGFQEVIHFFL